MNFLQPTYLWAISGILVPLAIHFWSKKDGKIIKVGSIQFLNQSNAVKSKSVHLQEYLLLLLRILSILLLAFILAKPQLKSERFKNKVTYIVEPSLLNNTSFKPILDTLKTSAVKLLATGFPTLETEYLDTLSIPNYWQLAHEMQSLQTDSIVVFSKGLANGISGIRPQIQNGMNWVVFPTNNIKNKPLLAVKGKENINIYSIKSEADNTEISNKKIPLNNSKIKWNAAKDSLIIENFNIPVLEQKPLKVLIGYSKDFETDMTFCKASLQAVKNYFESPISVEITKDQSQKKYTEYDLVIWLRNDEAPNIQKKIIIYNPNAFATSILDEIDEESVYHLTEKLNSETIINKGFTEKLIEIIFPQKQLKKQIHKNDLRTVNTEELSPNYSLQNKNKTIQQASVDLSSWFGLSLFLVFIIERIISKIRKQ